MKIKGEDIMYLGGVTVISSLQQALFARRVGLMRGKHGVKAPEMTGPPEFVRTLRAQQNSVECYPLYMSAMWMSGIFFNQKLAAAGGILYMVAREKFYKGYQEDADKRIPGFKASALIVMVLNATALLGVTHIIIKEVFDVSLKKEFLKLVGLK